MGFLTYGVTTDAWKVLDFGAFGFSTSGSGILNSICTYNCDCVASSENDALGKTVDGRQSRQGRGAVAHAIELVYNQCVSK